MAGVKSGSGTCWRTLTRPPDRVRHSPHCAVFVCSRETARSSGLIHARVELDLLQLSTGEMTQAGATAAEIMGRNIFQPASLCSPPNDLPDDFSVDSFAPNLVSAVHCPKNRSCRYSCSSGPSVYCGFHPARDPHCSDVTPLAQHIRQKPVAIALFEVSHFDRNQLSTPQSAAQQNSK